MKKFYSELELEVLFLAEDIVSTSETFTFGDDNNFDDNSNVDNWEW